MNTVAVIGSQWGDEGKGKITDYLASKADMVVRFQGGNNAGHTIKFDGLTFALHLIPSGIFNKKAINVLANGMVIDPVAFLEEVTMLKEAKIDTSNIVVSKGAHVILPFHKAFDHLFESLKDSTKKVGTTAKGIGPAYMDKASRHGIRMGDFVDKTRFKKYLETHLVYVNKVLSTFGKETFDSETLFKQYETVIEAMSPYVKETPKLIYDTIEAGKRVVFEGAQGTMLCLDHGTYPYVTSSSPTAASIPLNTGVSPQMINEVVGIMKAYTTRVGGGFFTTEFDDALADTIRIQGNEFGTTTGRPRRIGWLDTVVLNHAKRINGFTSLAIMLLDVLKGIHPLKICVAYKLDGELIDYVPSTVEDYERCEPVYLELDGFDEDISGIKDFNDLPENAKNYVNKISELIGVDIGMVSVGPDRTQTMMLKKL